MSYRKIKDGNSYNVPIDTYYCDYEADIQNLNIDEVSKNAEWGSKVYCLENSTWYIKNSDGEWIEKQKTEGGSVDLSTFDSVATLSSLSNGGYYCRELSHYDIETPKLFYRSSLIDSRPIAHEIQADGKKTTFQTQLKTRVRVSGDEGRTGSGLVSLDVPNSTSIATYGNKQLANMWLVDRGYSHDQSIFNIKKGTIDLHLRWDDLPRVNYNTEGYFPNGRNGFIFQYISSTFNETSSAPSMSVLLGIAINNATNNVRVSLLSKDTITNLDNPEEKSGEVFVEIPFDDLTHRFTITWDSNKPNNQGTLYIDGKKTGLTFTTPKYIGHSIAFGARHTDACTTYKTSVNIVTYAIYSSILLPKGSLPGMFRYEFTAVNLSYDPDVKFLNDIIKPAARALQSDYGNRDIIPTTIHSPQKALGYINSLLNSLKEAWTNKYNESDFTKRIFISSGSDSKYFYPYFWTNSSVFIKQPDISVLQAYGYGGLSLTNFACFELVPDPDNTAENIYSIGNYYEKGSDPATAWVIREGSAILLIDMTDPTGSSSIYESTSFGNNNRTFATSLIAKLAEIAENDTSSLKLRLAGAVSNGDTYFTLGEFKSRKDPNVYSTKEDWKVGEYQWTPGVYDGVAAQDYFRDFMPFCYLEIVEESEANETEEVAEVTE